MIKIFFVLGIGFCIGFFRLIQEKLIQVNCRLQSLWLFLLIFCMGASIGRNGEVIRTLPRLGGKALLFAVFTVAGSIAFVYLFSRFFLEKEEEEE